MDNLDMKKNEVPDMKNKVATEVITVDPALDLKQEEVAAALEEAMQKEAVN